VATAVTPSRPTWWFISPRLRGDFFACRPCRRDRPRFVMNRLRLDAGASALGPQRVRQCSRAIDNQRKDSPCKHHNHVLRANSNERPTIRALADVRHPDVRRRAGTRWRLDPRVGGVGAAAAQVGTGPNRSPRPRRQPRRPSRLPPRYRQHGWIVDGCLPRNRCARTRLTVALPGSGAPHESEHDRQRVTGKRGNHFRLARSDLVIGERSP